MKLVKPTGNYSVQDDDEVILYQSGDPAIILPPATGSGRVITIVNLGIGTANIYPQELQTVAAAAYRGISGGTTVQVMDIDKQLWITL